jgi:hypothetical protein
MTIYIDGLERSGNVYLSYAIGMTTGCHMIAERTHRLETLKEYNQEHPFIVPVRDALTCIASAKIFRDKTIANSAYPNKTEDPDQLVKRFLEYTEYLVNNPKFFIAPFHEFTKDHGSVIQKISNQYPTIEIRNIVTPEEVKARCLEDEGVLDPELVNLPRPTPKKTELEEMFNSKWPETIKYIQSNIDKLYQRYYDLP